MNTIEVDRHGFPRTSGIFETIKTIEGSPIAFVRHMRRAFESALELGITIPTEDHIRTEIAHTIAQNPHPVGRLRVSLGKKLMHITHDAYSELQEPARLNFYSLTVINSMHKIFPYDERFAILQAAQDEGFHDSVLFNDRNEITETSVANLIFHIDGHWVTSPITSGILPGVTRAIAIQHCGVTVRPIHISEIPEVESALLVASLRIAQPISHIGEMKLKIGDSLRALEDQIRAHCQPVSLG